LTATYENKVFYMQPSSERRNEKRDPIDLKKMREQVSRRRREEGGDQPPSDGGAGITSTFVRDCLANEQLGDGMLYAELHRGKLVFDASSGRWLAWVGHHWKYDETFMADRAVIGVAEAYLEEARKVGEEIREAIAAGNEVKAKGLVSLQKKLQTRAIKLYGTSRKGESKGWAFQGRNPLLVLGPSIDANPWLLACANGVIDLKSGVHRAGRPEDYLLRACPHEWQGIDAPAPTWDAFLLEIFEGDQEMVSYMLRLMGYGLVGEVIEHCLPILHGGGRNGKGTLVETLLHVLGRGQLACTVPTEMLLDQGKNKSSSGVSPDIMSLRGARMAFGSESDEGRVFSKAAVKRLSGGDSLVGRNPYDKGMTSFIPSHLLMIMTNHLPRAGSEDYAFWARVHLIRFNLRFVEGDPTEPFERRMRKDLPEALRKEAPGILASLVRGCLEWQRIGLAPPDTVRNATKEYRRDEDQIGDFLEECCVVSPDASVRATELYDDFKEWWTENVSKKSHPSQKSFGQYLKDRFEKRKTAGTYKYFGIGLAHPEA
jgi:putative DNA primase/helicase